VRASNGTLRDGFVVYPRRSAPGNGDEAFRAHGALAL
jgi:hypothetical protein